MVSREPNATNVSNDLVLVIMVVSRMMVSVDAGNFSMQRFSVTHPENNNHKTMNPNVNFTP
jgi:hypothetical protein